MKHFCPGMAQHASLVCPVHSSAFDCPDVLVWYESKFDEYGLIVHDGSGSNVLIAFCPWCGTKLPESKRQRWFDDLEKLGFDNPLNEDIPPQYRDDTWYR